MKYFHLSKSKLNELDPRSPDNYFTRNNHEHGERPRISVAPSIEKCLIGFSDPYLGKNEPELYVYEINIENIEHKKPTKKEVPDRELTDEMWILEPIEANCIGKIRVLKNRENDKKSSISFYDNKISCWVGKRQYTSWTWDYEWIK